jgi:uncharacterized protein YbaR (Trm112 family)
MTPKVCPECNGLCVVIMVKSNPKASEHYCEKCHKSYPVFKEKDEQK